MIFDKFLFVHFGMVIKILKNLEDTVARHTQLVWDFGLQEHISSQQHVPLSLT